MIQIIFYKHINLQTNLVLEHNQIKNKFGSVFVTKLNTHLAATNSFFFFDQAQTSTGKEKKGLVSNADIDFQITPPKKWGRKGANELEKPPRSQDKKRKAQDQVLKLCPFLLLLLYFCYYNEKKKIYE